MGAKLTKTPGDHNQANAITYIMVRDPGSTNSQQWEKPCVPRALYKYLRTSYPADTDNTAWSPTPSLTLRGV